MLRNAAANAEAPVGNDLHVVGFGSGSFRYQAQLDINVQFMNSPAVAGSGQSCTGFSCTPTPQRVRGIEVTRTAVAVSAWQLFDLAIDAGTYGGEPHMPFGSVKQSGSRKPGLEAIAFSFNLENVYVTVTAAHA